MRHRTMRQTRLRLVRFMAVTAAFAATGLALTACGGSGPGDGTAGSTPPSASPSTPPPSTSEEQSMGPDDGKVKPGYALQIIVTKTGGFAGVEDRLVIAEDGTWEYTGSHGPQGESGTLTSEQLDRLHTLAVATELFAPPEKTKPDHQCADMFQYGLTVGDMTARSNECGEPPNETFKEMMAIVVEATPM